MRDESSDHSIVDHFCICSGPSAPVSALALSLLAAAAEH